MRLVLYALLFATTTMAHTLAQTAQRFDGDWKATLTCATMSDGTKGYIFEFPATVHGGQMHGEHGTRGQADWLQVNGPIQADGSATLLVNGLTGDVNYTVGRVATATPYRYHVTAHFDATQGLGQRVELRACTLRFVR
jgi:hypothetical protein